MTDVIKKSSTVMCEPEHSTLSIWMTIAFLACMANQKLGWSYRHE
jgi:hypothetical protein